MPDSWIDKKELEDLVGSFAPPRKSRRKPLPPRSRGDEAPGVSQPPAAEPAAVVAVSVESAAVEEVPVEVLELETAPDESGPVVAAEPLSSSEEDPPQAVPVDGIPATGLEETDPDPDPVVGFAEDSETGSPLDALASEVPETIEEVIGETIGEILSDLSPTAPGLPMVSDEEVPSAEESIAPTEEEPGEALPGTEPAPPLPEALEEAGPEAPENVLEESAPGSPALDGNVPPPRPLEPPEIRIESAAEALRELPPFLDDPLEEVPAPRPVSLSERDADRALIALAEARARVEQSQLLRVRPNRSESSLILPTPQPEPASERPAPPPLPEPEASFEPGTVSLEPPTDEPDSGPSADPGESPFPEPTEFVMEEPASPDDSPESGPSPEAAADPDAGTEEDALELFRGERFLRRIERFGEEARRRLDAREVIVCDRDGLILYSDAEEGSGGVLETALLLEVSAKANRLLGLASSRATQVSAGSGLWRCLLKEAGAGGELYAGLLLPEPLEEEAVAFWTRVLSEVTGTPALTPN
jgi:hypothetical protein